MQVANVVWKGRGRNAAVISWKGEPWLVYNAGDGFEGCISARNLNGGNTLHLSESGIDSSDLAATGSDQTAFAVWNQLENGVYQLFAGEFPAAEAEQITAGRFPAVYPAAAFDATGRPSVVYQRADDQGNFNIYLQQKSSEGWTKPLLISDIGGNNWCPAIACTTDGRLAVAWDGYAGGSYDIYLRFVQQDGRLSPVRRLTDDNAFNAHVSLAAAPDGDLWVAWNSGIDNWGKDNEVYRNTRISERRYLHVHRKLELCRISGDKILPVYPPVQDALDHPLPGLLHERPRLYSAPGGILYVGFRFNEGELKGGHRNEKRWQAMLTCFDGISWSKPVEMPDAYGLSTGAIGVTEAAGSLFAAATGEGGAKADRDLNTSVYVHRLEPLAEALTIENPPVAKAFASLPAALQRPPRHSLTHNGRAYNLYYGDVHRHTEFSFCRTSVDGSLEEAYRQTADAAAMDFGMAADHDHQEQSPDMWAQVMMAADRFYVPGRFTTFFGYEWIGGLDNRRHRNVVSAVRPPVPPFDYDERKHRDVRNLWASLTKGKAITIPHHTACGMSLRWLQDPGEAADAEFEPLVEIFQASRTSSEYPNCPTLCNAFYQNGEHRSFNVQGGFVSDALQKGIRMGFIASSDHMSAHRSYACIYAEENTREGLLAAMKARRTFAATDRIVCEFSATDTNGQTAMMGGEFAPNGEVDVHIKFIGTDSIREVALLRDSEPFRTWQPGAAEASIEVTLQPEDYRGHYLYVRMIQNDTNMAWSSPIWFD